MLCDGTDLYIDAKSFIKMVDLTKQYFESLGHPVSFDEIGNIQFIFDFEDNILNGLQVLEFDKE